MTARPRTKTSRLRALLGSRDFLTVAVPLALVLAASAILAVKLVRPAPPSAIRFLAGPKGSNYLHVAESYKKHIERHGVKVEVLESAGALDNIRRLAAADSTVDVGFVQAGLHEGIDVSNLESLGTVFPQPLLIYERMPEDADQLTALTGKRLAIGPEGSGTRALALKLLRINDMESSVTLTTDAGEAAVRALKAGEVDAAFLMGDSATMQIMKELRAVPGVHIMNLRQADAYARVFEELDKVTLPEGAMDFAKNHPGRTLSLVSAPVELIAHADLHPALSDVLIAAAREIHGTSSMFRDAGTFPALIEHDIPLSEEATRYYKAGGQFLYKRLPFWLASLVDRILVVVLPLLVIVVPATRIAPSLYRWRVRSRIYRWYGALMSIEREMLAKRTPEQLALITGRLDEIERAVDAIRTPPSFADQLYVLREHISLVRRRLQGAGASAPG